MREIVGTFFLENTTADQFAQWLEDYVQSTPALPIHVGERIFVLTGAGVSLPITRLTRIGLHAVELAPAGSAGSIRRLLRPSPRQRQLKDVIAFDVEPLGNDRVAVTGSCSPPAARDVMDRFRSLMITIARRWPSAARMIAEHFPPDRSPAPAMRSLALLDVDLGNFEVVLRRFATGFAHQHGLGNDTRVEAVPRDLHPTGGPLTPWEPTGWNVQIATTDGFEVSGSELVTPRKVIFTKAVHLSQSLYAYRVSDYLELVAPDEPMVYGDEALHRRFIQDLLDELGRLSLVISTRPEPEGATLPQFPREDVAGKRGGRPGLDHDELIYRLAKAQQAEEARAADPRKRWRDIAEEVGWAYGNKQDGLALLRDARHRLRRLEPGDPLLEEITAWRRAKKTNKT
jgi:hypothetical protein